MRISFLAIFALASLTGNVAQARQVEAVSVSPRHIAIAASCWTGSACQQQASDVAQGYCYDRFIDGPRRALYVRTEPGERSLFQERVVFIFRCDRRSIICQAGSCN
jgi:hypothetical protein